MPKSSKDNLRKALRDINLRLNHISPSFLDNLTYVKPARNIIQRLLGLLDLVQLDGGLFDTQYKSLVSKLNSLIEKEHLDQDWSVFITSMNDLEQNVVNSSIEGRRNALKKTAIMTAGVGLLGSKVFADTNKITILSITGGAHMYDLFDSISETYERIKPVVLSNEYLREIDKREFQDFEINQRTACSLVSQMVNLIEYSKSKKSGKVIDSSFINCLNGARKVLVIMNYEDYKIHLLKSNNRFYNKKDFIDAINYLGIEFYFYIYVPLDEPWVPNPEQVIPKLKEIFQGIAKGVHFTHNIGKAEFFKAIKSWGW